MTSLTINCAGNAIKDLSSLASMPSLRVLALEEYKDEPTGSESNWKESVVEEMKFVRTRVSSQMLGVARLMRSLKSLELTECSGFNPEGEGLAVEKLTIRESCSELGSLNNWLKAFPQLRELHISGTVCKAADFHNLTFRTRLHVLSLSNCALRDEHILKVDDLGSLEFLGLQYNKGISVVSVKHIIDTSNVSTLELFGTAVQVKEARDLTSTNPSMIIDY